MHGRGDSQLGEWGRAVPGAGRSSKNQGSGVRGALTSPVQVLGDWRSWRGPESGGGTLVMGLESGPGYWILISGTRFCDVRCGTCSDCEERWRWEGSGRAGTR